MSKYDMESKRSPSTGDILGEGSKGQIVVYPFGPYEVIIKLSSSGEFMDILEIRINKDFRTFKQKVESRGYHDVNDIYEDK